MEEKYVNRFAKRAQSKAKQVREQRKSRPEGMVKRAQSEDKT